MSHASTLNHIHSTINQKLADVERRIERVKTAKKEIEKEHETGIVEIRQILHPHLNSHWTGDFANDFDGERDEAHTSMYNIVNGKYEGYISQMERKNFCARS